MIGKEPEFYPLSLYKRHLGHGPRTQPVLFILLVFPFLFCQVFGNLDSAECERRTQVRRFKRADDLEIAVSPRVIKTSSERLVSGRTETRAAEGETKAILYIDLMEYRKHSVSRIFIPYGNVIKTPTCYSVVRESPWRSQTRRHWL